MNDLGTGQAIGKIILMGEHSVVFGKPAIALPFTNAQITAKIFYIDGPITIDCIYFNGLLELAPDTIYGIKQLIYVTLVFLKQPFKNLHIKIDATLPSSRGLGSSAAVSIAIVRSLFDAFDATLTEEKLKYFVDIAETIHHLNPSGVDATTIMSNRAVFFDSYEGKKFIPCHLEGLLVVADTGKQGFSKEAVADVRKLMNENPTIINPIMERLGELTEDVRKYLANNQIIRLGLAMTEAHQLLNQINVSDPKLERLVKVALDAGALGAKLTGSGKGGCMIALAKDFNQAQKLSNTLKINGAVSTWVYNLGDVINEI